MNNKQAAGEKAVNWIQDGMIIGLGTGSTAYFATLKVGELVKEGLRIQAIPTSKSTEELALKLGIPLTTFAAVSALDVTVDGADAVSPNLDLIKGGGGALLREKLVAKASKKLIIVADDTKKVESFNGVSIPIEVVPFAWEVTNQRIIEVGGQTTLRVGAGKPFVTDNANFILDTVFDEVISPMDLHSSLKGITGVVETGLFPRMADIVIFGTNHGTDVVFRNENPH